ncbi:MAG: hypothetical protein ABSG01_08970 [Anaerolineales bacterium]|jgi:hypothetical protein
MSARCDDCKKPYKHFGLDTSLSDEQWKQIHSEGTNGVLCANCMVKRASRLGGFIDAHMVFEDRETFVERMKEKR